MLQLGPGSQFNVLMPDFGKILISDKNYSPDSIYKIASQTLPRLKEIEYELKASKKQIAAAREASLQHFTWRQLFTGYYTLLNDTSSQRSYSTQMNDNFGQAIVLPSIYQY